MDKQKEIEEMAKVIRPILENRTDIGYIPALDKVIAEELVKHYRKIDKDSVVISKEEYEQLLKEKTINISIDEQLKKEYEYELKQVCKETAEKFAKDIKLKLNELKEFMHKHAEHYDALTKSLLNKIFEDIDIIAKQFGVDIKEVKND